jgi:hypothetical protein
MQQSAGADCRGAAAHKLLLSGYNLLAKPYPSIVTLHVSFSLLPEVDAVGGNYVP